MTKVKLAYENVYREKIGDVFDDEDFFYPVYREAMRITKELVCPRVQENIENEQCKEVYRGYKGKTIEVNNISYRTGNNIITFCGTRGQGKTSAMLTYSNFLKNAKWSVNNRQDLLDDLKGIFEKNDFYVLDPVDPSAIGSHEPIVRVVLSILFNEAADLLDNYYRWYGKEGSRDEIRIEKDKLMHRFADCFRSVDYSVKDNKDDFGMDDLELLSQLGSSNQLRRNLQKLIEDFLSFQSKFVEGRTYKYLVIQIDDSDLALENGYKLCEDIRNFFSLTNVIVLMATDIKQLTNTITQEYVRKYERLIGTAEDGLKEHYLTKCQRMAKRYVEKMFPVGHIIELPSIEELIKRNPDSLMIEYKESDNCKDRQEAGKDSKNGKDNLQLSFGGDSERTNLQNQLLGMLYSRTGVIFKKDKSGLHRVLPKTLRELSHFMVMLRNMELVDLRAAYTNNCEQTERLRNNLDILENYFFDYWAPNNLTEQEYVELCNTIKMIIPDKDHVLYGFEDIERKENEKEGKIPKDNKKFSYELKRAYDIYYTIFLNSRFAEIASDNGNGAGEVAELIRNKFIEPWNDIPVNCLKIATDEHLHLLLFECKEVNNETTEKAKKTSRTEVEKIADKKQKQRAENMTSQVSLQDEFYPFVRKKPEVAVPSFDISKVILDSLVNWELKKEDENQTDNTLKRAGYASRIESGEPSRVVVDNRGDDVLHIIGIKNIFANIEIYDFITAQIQKAFKEFDLDAFARVEKVYQTVFGTMNFSSQDIQYLAGGKDCVTKQNRDSTSESAVIDIWRMGDEWYGVYKQKAEDYVTMFWKYVKATLTERDYKKITANFERIFEMRKEQVEVMRGRIDEMIEKEPMTIVVLPNGFNELLVEVETVAEFAMYDKFVILEKAMKELKEKVDVHNAAVNQEAQKVDAQQSGIHQKSEIKAQESTGASDVNKF